MKWLTKFPQETENTVFITLEFESYYAIISLNMQLIYLYIITACQIYMRYLH